MVGFKLSGLPRGFERQGEDASPGGLDEGKDGRHISHSLLRNGGRQSASQVYSVLHAYDIHGHFDRNTLRQKEKSCKYTPEPQAK